jgi:hypothetical protein
MLKRITIQARLSRSAHGKGLPPVTISTIERVYMNSRRRFAPLCIASAVGVILVLGAVAPSSAATTGRAAATVRITANTCFQETCDNQDPPTTSNSHTGTNCAANAVDVPANKVYNVAGGGLEMRWSTGCDMNWTRFTPGSTNSQIVYVIWIQTENGNEKSDNYQFTAKAGVQFYSNGLYAPDAASACVEEIFNHRVVDSFCTPPL